MEVSLHHCDTEGNLKHEDSQLWRASFSFECKVNFGGLFWLDIGDNPQKVSVMLMRTVSVCSDFTERLLCKLQLSGVSCLKLSSGPRSELPGVFRTPACTCPLPSHISTSRPSLHCDYLLCGCLVEGSGGLWACLCLSCDGFSCLCLWTTWTCRGTAAGNEPSG